MSQDALVIFVVAMLLIPMAAITAFGYFHTKRNLGKRCDCE